MSRIHLINLICALIIVLRTTYGQDKDDSTWNKDDYDWSGDKEDWSGDKDDSGSTGTNPTNYEEYTIDGLVTKSIKGSDTYSTVVILLHGGGSSNAEWTYLWEQGWLGNGVDIKYVFPTSARAGGTWHETYKITGCGIPDDCSYNIPSITEEGNRIASLIKHELNLVGGDSSKVYLGGFSQGSQMAMYMQLAKLNYPLGGVILMSGSSIPPLSNIPGMTDAQAMSTASYTGQDMNFFIWHGTQDGIFTVPSTIDLYHAIFDKLGIRSTITFENVVEGQGHDYSQAELETMVGFWGGSMNFGIGKLRGLFTSALLLVLVSSSSYL